MPAFDASGFYLYDLSDPSKKIHFDISSLTTGTEPAVVIPAIASGSSILLPTCNSENDFSQMNKFQAGAGTDTPCVELTTDRSVTTTGRMIQMRDNNSGVVVYLGMSNPVAGDRDIFFPDATTTLAGLAVAETFTKTQTFTPDTDVPGIKVNGNAGAVANLQEWYDSSPALAAYVDATGRMFSGGGFAMYTGANAITLAPAALTASRTATFPDVTGTVCLIAATQTLSGKTITNLKVATTVSGMPVVSGNGADPPAANLMGKVAKTAQTAAIAATKITDTCPAGMYRVTYYLETTTANAGDGSYVFQVNYTDRVGATNQVTAGNLALTATTTGTTALKGEFVFYLASGDVTYQTTLTGAHTTSRYSVDARCEYLG